MDEFSIKEPEVYIIVLNYNGQQDTIECVNSLLKINYQNFKIVIVDNHSTDRSIQEISGYFRNKNLMIRQVSGSERTERFTRLGKVVMIRADKNGGYGYGNNLGIKFARANGADYILLLNNDTVVDPDFLTPLVSLCESDRSIGIASGKIFFFDEPETIWFNGGGFKPLTGKVGHYNFNKKDTGSGTEREITFISGCMMLVPESILNDTGIINEDYFMYLEDLEFSQRVLKKGYKLRISQTSKIWHKVSIDPKKRLSKFKTYYMAKNKVKYISDNLSPFYRITSLFYLILITPLALIANKRPDLLSAHFKGIKDGF